MAHLHIDMPSGIAGDMLLAALLDAGGDLDQLRAALARLDLPAVEITCERVLVGGLAARRATVHAPQEALWVQPQRVQVDLRSARRQPAEDHRAPAALPPVAAPGHRPYHVIRDLLERPLGLPPRAVARAQAVFRLLAEAEAEVHGTTAEAVEFHEVGALDAIVDVVGCCLLLEQLDVTRITASPILPGHGTVSCAHGRMPVPVPAVARMLLRELPQSACRAPWRSLPFTTGELTTPTGCALVCALADAFIDGPGAPQTLTLRSVGYGAGTKEIPNLVNACRVLLSDERPAAPAGDTVVELVATIDDATGEQLAFAIERLLAAGALDAYLTPVVMKKGRPGCELTVLAAPDMGDRLAQAVLLLTPTIGLRRQTVTRSVLPRRQVTVRWRSHDIPCKVVDLPDGTRRAKPEFDALRTAALAEGLDPGRIAREVLALMDV